MPRPVRNPYWCNNATPNSKELLPLLSNHIRTYDNKLNKKKAERQLTERLGQHQSFDDGLAHFIESITVQLKARKLSGQKSMNAFTNGDEKINIVRSFQETPDISHPLYFLDFEGFVMSSKEIQDESYLKDMRSFYRDDRRKGLYRADYNQLKRNRDFEATYVKIKTMEDRYAKLLIEQGIKPPPTHFQRSQSHLLRWEKNMFLDTEVERRKDFKVEVKTIGISKEIDLEDHLHTWTFAALMCSAFESLTVADADGGSNYLEQYEALVERKMQESSEYSTLNSLVAQIDEYIYFYSPSGSKLDFLNRVKAFGSKAFTQ